MRWVRQHWGNIQANPLLIGLIANAIFALLVYLVKTALARPLTWEFWFIVGIGSLFLWGLITLYHAWRALQASENRIRQAEDEAKSLTSKARLLDERISRLVGELKVFQDLFAVDDSIFKLLPKVLARTQNREQAMERLLEEVLSDAMDTFGDDINRAAILRVEATFLRPWVLVGMPDSVRGHRYYIGDDSSFPRGTAGEVFRSGKRRVVHFDLVDGIWKADDPSFIEFAGPRRRTSLQSFIALPLQLDVRKDNGTTETLRLGVVCFDSPSRACFDPSRIQEALLPGLSKRIVAILAIERQLRGDQGST